MTAGLAWTALIAASFGFALGSVPFGVLVLRVAGRPDPRTIGSGNIGATNVVRAGGKALGAITLLLDAGKGVAAALLAALLLGASVAPVAALGSIVGHCFTPWLAFRGGKGVATFLGASVVAGAAAPLTFLFTWLGVFAFSRVSAMAGVTACLATAGFVLVRTAVSGRTGLGPTGAMDWGAPMALLLGALLIAARHRSNFQQMLASRRERVAGGSTS